MQEYLATVHGRWKSLLEACVKWGHAEARPLGLAPGGRDEFGNNYLLYELIQDICSANENSKVYWF